MLKDSGNEMGRLIKLPTKLHPSHNHTSPNLLLFFPFSISDLCSFTINQSRLWDRGMIWRIVWRDYWAELYNGLVIATLVFHGEDTRGHYLLFSGFTGSTALIRTACMYRYMEQENLYSILSMCIGVNVDSSFWLPVSHVILLETTCGDFFFDF